MDGTIVIGEGERDEAPMLYIGEKVGLNDGGDHPEVDIAVYLLEGTILSAKKVFRVPSPWTLPLNAADCCTLPTVTWRRWWLANPAKAWSIWKPRSATTLQ